MEEMVHDDILNLYVFELIVSVCLADGLKEVIVNNYEEISVRMEDARP